LSLNGPDSSAVIVPHTQITVIAAGTKLIRVDAREALNTMSLITCCKNNRYLLFFFDTCLQIYVWNSTIIYLDAAVVRLFDNFTALAVDQRPQPQCFVAASCDERVPIQQQQARDLIRVTDQSQ
jgi:hypothetical protein